MDLQQLRCFVAAVELRSISDAAKALDVSQPAVTRSLQNLEQSVDTTLLERTSRGVKPTAAGKIFYEHARGILSQVERSVSALARLKGEGPMTVEIGTTPSFVDHLLPFSRLRPPLVRGIHLFDRFLLDLSLRAV